MVRLLLVLSIVACGSKTPHATEPRTKDVLAELAKEIDPGPQPALWPQVPAEVRTLIEGRVPRDLIGDARLVAARERLANWSMQFSTTDPETLVAKLERAFEGVYLAEPLALAQTADPTTSPARALLWDFYSTFTHSAPLLRTLATSWRIDEPAFVRALGVAEQLAKGGVKMRDHFGAELLRANTPGQSGGSPTGSAGRGATALRSTLEDILWQHAGRKRREGNASAVGLYREILRRRANPTTYQEWIEVARAHISLEDPERAAETLARARATAPPTDRTARASLLDLERDRATLVRLLALPRDDLPATRLARFDALLELGRIKEAERLLDALARERPKDARVRARAVQLRLSEGEISDRLVDGLRGDDLVDRDALYWSVRIGAAGMAFKVASSREALDELATSARELAQFQPGRAAAIAFVMERVVQLTSGTAADEKAILKLLRDSYEPALALRAKYPDTADVDRIVLTLSLFHTNPVTGFGSAIAKPKTTPDDDPELYSQRAHVLVTLAAYIGKAADFGAVQRAIEEVPPSDRDMESSRFALLGDVEMMRAIHGEPAAWQLAVARWETAMQTSQHEHGRLQNNLGWAASLAGDEVRAMERWQASYRIRTDRRWVPLLNIATISSTSATDRLDIIRALAEQLAPKTPGLVNAWRAASEPDAAVVTTAAAKALEDFDATLSFHQVALHSRGLVTEGAFKLGVGLRSGRRGHDFSTSAHATLWLARPLPLTRAELEAKAKPPAPPPKKKK